MAIAIGYLCRVSEDDKTFMDYAGCDEVVVQAVADEAIIEEGSSRTLWHVHRKAHSPQVTRATQQWKRETVRMSAEEDANQEEHRRLKNDRKKERVRNGQKENRHVTQSS